MVGYIYGVILACGFEGDQLEKGLLIQQVFEQLFPNNGRSLADFCNRQVAEKNPDFKESARLGFAEMIDFVNSDGREPLKSLIGHVCKDYFREE